MYFLEEAKELRESETIVNDKSKELIAHNNDKFSEF